MKKVIATEAKHTKLWLYDTKRVIMQKIITYCNASIQYYIHQIERNCAIDVYSRYKLGGIRDYSNYHRLNWIQRLIIKKKNKKVIKKYCPTCDSYNKCGIKYFSNNKIGKQ